MKKITAVIILTVLLQFRVCSGAAAGNALTAEEAEKQVKAAVSVVSCCGPARELSDLFYIANEYGLAGPGTIRDREKLYRDISCDGDANNTYLTFGDVYSVLLSVFTKELADKYLAMMREIKVIEDGKELPLYVESEGVIFENRQYGEPVEPYILSVNVSDKGNGEAAVYVRYKYREYTPEGAEDPELSPYPVLKAKFVIENRKNGWVFNEFTDIKAVSDRNAHPDPFTIYPDEWINPNTADGPVYIIAAAALISLSGAVLCKNKIRKEN